MNKLFKCTFIHLIIQTYSDGLLSVLINNLLTCIYAVIQVVVKHLVVVS